MSKTVNFTTGEQSVELSSEEAEDIGTALVIGALQEETILRDWATAFITLIESAAVSHEDPTEVARVATEQIFAQMLGTKVQLTTRKQEEQ